MILFDTDTLTLLFKENAKVIRHVEQAAERFAISLITRIEVLKGRFDAVLKADDSNRLRQAIIRLERSEQFLERIMVVPFDESALQQFDQLRWNKKIKKIGRADLLIASIALVRKARLITRNLKDFQQVPGLQVENWAD